VSRRLEYHRRAIEDLEGLHPSPKRRIWEHLRALAEEPYPPGCQALKGPLAGGMKLRVGDYRIVCVVEEDVIHIVRAAHRHNIYKELGRA
jgi:mRNA interferase RelE/StbE